MKPSAGGSRSSGFDAVTCSMYPVGLERLDQCFHFGQSIRLRQLGSRSRGVSTEQAVKRRYLVQPSDLFGYADGSQQIAPPSVCPDDAQYRVPGGKFVVKREQSRRCRITRRLPILADFVAKVENRSALKISRKPIFGLLCCCIAFQRGYEGPCSILDETIWSLTSPGAQRISGSKNFRSPPQKNFCNKICY